eukprot:3658176-Lingulodinium_polyedra.AAC.1
MGQSAGPPHQVLPPIAPGGFGVEELCLLGHVDEVMEFGDHIVALQVTLICLLGQGHISFQESESSLAERG